MSLVEAAERLQTELGEHLRPDTEVLLDAETQNVRQPLAFGEGGPELQARFLLGGPMDALPVGGLLRLLDAACRFSPRNPA